TTKHDFRSFTEALRCVGLQYEVGTGRLQEIDSTPGGPTLEEQRARAQVLATQLRPPFRTRAVELLEAMSKRPGYGPADRFLLARLYEAEGNPRKARDELRGLVASQRNSPLYVNHYARFLLRQHELDEVDGLIGQLAAIEQQRDAAPGGYGSI